MSLQDWPQDTKDEHGSTEPSQGENDEWHGPTAPETQELGNHSKMTVHVFRCFFTVLVFTCPCRTCPISLGKTVSRRARNGLMIPLPMAAPSGNTRRWL